MKRDLLTTIRAMTDLLSEAHVALDEREVALGLREELTRAEEGARSGYGPIYSPRAAAETQRAEAEAALRAMAYLADSTSALLETALDEDARWHLLATLIVPDLADACWIDVVDARGNLRRRAVQHWDPDRMKALRYAEGEPTPDSVRPLLGRIIAGGSEASRIHLVAAEEPLCNHLGDVRSAMCIPIRGAGSPLAALTCVFSESHRIHNERDLGIVTDLARRAGLAFENARLVHALQEEARTRDDLMAVVAHDLRNPLNTIVLAMRLLELQVGASNLTGSVIRAASRMTKLIENLLDVARVQGGAFTVQRDTHDLGDLLADAADAIRATAQDKGVDFALGEAPHVDVLVDRERMLQVLANLLANAVKFTPSGGRIRLDAIVADPLVIQVSDTGPGIAEDRIRTIFERGAQGPGSERQGIGLGLFIASAIVQAHGGRIGVDSVFGVGTTFTIEVPRGEAPLEDLPVATSASRGRTRDGTWSTTTTSRKPTSRP